MSAATIADRVRDMLAEQLNREPAVVTDGAELREDLDADSLDVVEIAMAIEAEFGIEVDDADLEAVHTVGDVIALVARLTD